ncbi:hypothetical protein GH714_043431 [Hevea brasiliensis]|uniref:Lipoyl-binding domain-containing protein n=1 Tax=Hevea brasiliensis TaxID=3981 RepID=A0A6A6K4J3_HEVBR|nr:hypothetical protein GH714_043431 [Hevea brasiliensis]
MGMKLFDDEDAQNVNISKIEIDKEFARRYEHNKQREALQRYQELKKRGQIEESGSELESESSDEEDDADISKLSKKEDLKKLFENLNKVRKRDDSVYQNAILFESENDSDDENENRERKKKAMKKTYNEEQEELKKEFLDAVKNAEEDGGGDLLKPKETKNENDEDADDDYGELEKELGEYFGPEGELDENNKFLKEFFEKQMWIDRENKDRSSVLEDTEVHDLLKDEEEIERQEKYEESYNFRYEENAGDKVMGHSRKVEGSVRKKENTRKEQRKNKEERMKIAEMERKEELKHLKNLKKKEMKERMMKVMETAGVKNDNDFALDLDNLEEDFDPAEYDKMMKKAFGEEYYNADDVDPGFGSDNDDDRASIEKPDFDKEDELLGLPKGWDAVEDADGFLAARERFLKLKAENGNDDDDNEEEEERGDGEEEGGGNEVEHNEESKRKRKRKMSLVKKAREEMLEDYYKLDYEGTIGDLKTRFKYSKVDPNRYGLKTKEILMLDDKELNQYVPIKKLAPYRERQWKGLKLDRNSSTFVKAQLNEVAVDGSSNAAASPSNKSEVPSQEGKNAKPSNEPSPPTLATEESISEFITQVLSLVKLVDSRDIVELQLKQLDCELIIRKKEALPQPPSPASVVMMHSPSPSPSQLMPPAPPAASSTASSPASTAPPPSPAPSAAKSPKSSLPSFKCPMAGTFYRSPAPGEPSFVKVGDKVQKGQVVCIIEAMKLMNEIEADQSGTIVEILAEDGRPVSVDTIQPGKLEFETGEGDLRAAS